MRGRVTTTRVVLRSEPMSSSKPNPLPLGDVLRDLAVLRASDVDLADGTSFPDAEPADSTNETDGTQKSVLQSYRFVKETREALKVHQRGDLDKQGDELGILRSKLEELRDGNHQRSVFQLVPPRGPKLGLTLLRNYYRVVVMTRVDKNAKCNGHYKPFRYQ